MRHRVTASGKPSSIGDGLGSSDAYQSAHALHRLTKGIGRMINLR
jgi:hypothetical protein